jgi:hypothetical protein
VKRSIWHYPPVDFRPYPAGHLTSATVLVASKRHRTRGLPDVGLREDADGPQESGLERKGRAVKRTFAIVVLCVALTGVLAVPALGAVDSNPNAVELSDVSCPEAGLFFDTIWVATEGSLAGHDLEGNTVGVAKSLYITDSEGISVPGGEIFHRPGRGLDNITVWCFWPDAGSPTGFIGGDVLFKAHLRPS